MFKFFVGHHSLVGKTSVCFAQNTGLPCSVTMCDCRPGLPWLCDCRPRLPSRTAVPGSNVRLRREADAAAERPELYFVNS